MRPDINSQKVLSYTQAIAKIIEFNVPKQDRDINIPKNPEELFTLVIGMLGDVSEEIIRISDFALHFLMPIKIPSVYILWMIIHCL